MNSQTHTLHVGVRFDDNHSAQWHANGNRKALLSVDQVRALAEGAEVKRIVVKKPAHPQHPLLGHTVHQGNNRSFLRWLELGYGFNEASKASVETGPFDEDASDMHVEMHLVVSPAAHQAIFGAQATH